MSIKDYRLKTSLINVHYSPFDQKEMWNNRPAYQQIWLIVHLSIVFGLLGIMLFNWLAK